MPICTPHLLAINAQTVQRADTTRAVVAHGAFVFSGHVCGIWASVPLRSATR